MSPVGDRAIVYREAGDVGADERRYLELIDLKQGRNMGLTALPAESMVLDAWPEKRLVLLRADDVHGDKAQLFFQRLHGAVLEPINSWNASPGDAGFIGVEKAWFLSPDRLLVTGGVRKSMSVWNWRTAAAVLAFPLAQPSSVHMGPRRRLAAVVSQGTLDLYDVVRGRHLGTLPYADSNGGLPRTTAVAIRPDQSEMAVVTRGCVTLWDLKAAREVRKLIRPEIRSSMSAHWVGDYLLVGGRYLYDLERRVLLWEYEPPGTGLHKTSTVAAGRLWYVSEPSRSLGTYLSSTPIPHQAVLDMAERLGDPDDLLVSRPGDAVELAVDIDPKVAPNDEVRAAITDNLEAAGLRVVDSAPLVVIATCKPLKRQAVRIELDSPRYATGYEPIVTRTIVPHVSEIHVIHGGKTVYRRGVTFTPGEYFLILRGETLNDALKRLTTPDIELIKNAQFNAYMTRQGDATENGAYGLSKLASDGVFEDVTAAAQ